MAREVRQVAVVVFCEAEGVDDLDAASGAAIALRQALRDAHVEGVALAEAADPACSSCGIRLPLRKDGTVRSHWPGEDGPVRRKEDNCSGVGLAPRAPDQPVVGYTTARGLPLFARIHDIMEAGMAIGNGYLWTRTTRKAFR